ncbi:FAD/NAD(P)-binding protein [Chamaesiphon sp. OTE_75_metabat_556]|uniref:FAD/NAD(P)-binding protein n=1 Tax=Chamaesiphon sp. OTE_75_metabat_556 TaxID=2964692 RepID=UPI00286D1C61|nr:FAD/NAD(P)-binding protein [Chamaesiphon sp. OTE_75_metabat_556]
MQYSSSTWPTNFPTDRTTSAKFYDLAIIGAGISSAYTLLHYLERLDRQFVSGRTQPIKIVVTEKSGEFWTGIPYGNRSGRTALLISPLKEFIPQQPERTDFINWLNEHRDWLFDRQVYAAQGQLASQWLDDNAADIDRGDWDDLFIPRHTFGLYLQSRLSTALTTATAKGLIECDLITADVWDIQRDGELFLVDLTTDAGGNRFTAKQLVLAIGSPPNLGFEQSAEAVKSGLCYIDDMYEPSLDFNLDRLCRSLTEIADPAARQVMIIGSNASTLDTIYSINNSPAVTNSIEKFIILSPSATFPHRINREVPAIDYTPHALVALVQTESFTAKQILAAVEQDVAGAIDQNINISDIYGDITKVVMQGLNLLNIEEQQQFVFRYAVEIGKFQRRAGGEYLDVVNDLVERRKLEFVKGRFVKQLPLPMGGAGCEYLDSEHRQPHVFDRPIGAIINCAGFQDVTQSSSPLIQNLLQREICQPNQSNRGFAIDQNFKASPNCYVMGPLVAGNIDGTFRVWHAESCQRILGLSKHLAKVLLSESTAVAPEIAMSEPATSATLIPAV